MGVLEEIIDHTVHLKTPGKGTVGLICGILNLFLLGIGTIIAGVLDNNVADIIIGLLQFFIFFVGWIWALIWGILMIIRNLT